MNLHQWAIKHNIPHAALDELLQGFGALDPTPTPAPVPMPQSEAANQAALRALATRQGERLWRNNVGATYTESGDFIRYGLANDSKQINERFKSSDLIGIKPVIITREMVGTKIGQFKAREVKPGGWRYTDTEHERAQLAFIQFIVAMGGDARFSNNGGDL